MMTVRKRVGPLPTHRLAMRHSVDYCSLDYFTSDDSSRDLPSNSSSEMPSNSSSDALSDSSYVHLSSDHSLLALLSGMRSSHRLCSSVPSIPYSSAATTERLSHSSFAGPSRKRSRSPTISISVSSPVPRALSFVCADLLPPRKRIRSFDSATDLEDCLDESSELSVPKETKINECIAYTDALRAERIDDRVVAETVAREEVEASTKGTVKVRVDRVTHPMVLDDIVKPAQEEEAIKGTYETLGDLVWRFYYHTVEILVHRVQVIKSIQRDQGHKIVATGQYSAVQSERISRNRGGDGNGNENRGVNGNGNGEGNGNGNDNGNEGGNGYENHNGNVIAAEPTRLQEAIRIANNLMDRKLKGNARNAENKRRFDNNPRENFGQQPSFKQQNVRGQNVARAYTARINEKKGDYTGAIALNTQRAPVRNLSELGSFDVIINMDWLAKSHAVIVCDEKIVRIPYGDEMLII
nr:reverse transcriptase domain-containing protein [Tanacetum cinerariifolium]